MWKDGSGSVVSNSLVDGSKDWKRIESVGVSCFEFYFDNMTEHQVFQIAWYLDANHITYDDVDGVIDFINYLSERNIYISRMGFRWLKTDSLNIRVNLAVFFKWYLALKIRYIPIRYRVKQNIRIEQVNKA